MNVTKVTTDRFRVPLGKPTRVSLTDPKPAAGPDAVELIVVHLETDAGVSGIGFATVLGGGAATVRTLIDTEIATLVANEDARETDRLLAKAEGHFRPVGFPGFAARAYSAIDIALWDIKAKHAGLPLFKLLGGARPASAFFVSDVGVAGRDPAEVLKAAKPLLKQGATGVRIEIGGGEVQADADRVREISDGLGDDAWVGVAAEGRFDLGTAQALAHFFEDVGVDWFEDPIPAADEAGYAKLASVMETPLAVGGGFASREAFFRVIRAGQIRTIRPDVGRLGGITPFLKVAAAAEAYQVSVSPVRLPELGVHLACGLGVVPHVDSVSWFRDVFTGGPKLEGGKLVPPGQPGLGVSVSDSAAKLRVN